MKKIAQTLSLAVAMAGLHAPAQAADLIDSRIIYSEHAAYTCIATIRAKYAEYDSFYGDPGRTLIDVGVYTPDRGTEMWGGDFVVIEPNVFYNCEIECRNNSGDIIATSSGEITDGDSCGDRLTRVGEGLNPHPPADGDFGGGGDF